METENTEFIKNQAADILEYYPNGLMMSTLERIVAAELGVELHETSYPISRAMEDYQIIFRDGRVFASLLVQESD